LSNQLAEIFTRPPEAEDADTWGELRLRVRTYLTGALPPLELVSSVRAVVLVDAGVIVVRDPTRQHILPGGRREAGEALEQTLRREVLEETGWEIAAPRQLGVVHFHHLTPRPEGYRYPYPDFLHVVYAAAGVRHDPAARKADD
jgi:ADP-ribose pyrophosphatase YjhB (NUDIX family)